MATTVALTRTEDHGTSTIKWAGAKDQGRDNQTMKCLKRGRVLVERRKRRRICRYELDGRHASTTRKPNAG